MWLLEDLIFLMLTWLCNWNPQNQSKIIFIELDVLPELVDQALVWLFTLLNNKVCWRESKKKLISKWKKSELLNPNRSSRLMCNNRFSSLVVYLTTFWNILRVDSKIKIMLMIYWPELSLLWVVTKILLT